MAEIINLRTVRKRAARSKDQARAAQNRALHGQTREQITAAKAERASLNRVLDHARREDDAPAAEP
ncbi:MAG: DUF4169 family protein [Brevundimonas sp.]|uniref:DUF4169 family protein n=1 Tax=Brevundimonas sp. TaxID=1871086 RepID=UPI003918F63E